MSRKLLLLMLLALLIGTLNLASRVEKARASGTIHIRANGYIDPHTANITTIDNVTYTFTDNIFDSIVVERNNIVIDGAGNTLQGIELGIGIDLTGKTNVTVQNTQIQNFEYAILLNDTSSSSISGNNMTNNSCGITLYSPSNYNSVSGNNITANHDGGIRLYSSSYNNIHGNNITANSMGDGISLHDSSSYNNIHGNNIIANSLALYGSSSYNNIHGNNITANNIYLGSSNNSIYHNNFANNTNHIDYSSMNVWDDGYPSGGNYWSDYTGVDSYHDGIGDTVYVMDGNNTDRYPLMGMFSDFNATLEHHVQTICNSTISEFHFNGTAICFNVTGDDGTLGFCRICIPTALMNSTYAVFVNGTEVQYDLLLFSNSTHNYLYFTYSHSTQEVIVVPEFPSLLILPLFIIATFLTAIIYRKRKVRFEAKISEGS